MTYNLTILERMVLECLGHASKEMNELKAKTGIGKDILGRVTQSLLSKNLINIYKNEYQINQHKNQLIKNELNDSTALLCEVNEIISCCVRRKLDSTDSNGFKMKKVNMSEREEKIYRGLLYNLESFLNSLAKTDQIKDQKIIFWGEGNYETIKNNILEY